MITFRRARPEEMDIIMDLVVRIFTGEQEIPLELNYIPEEKEPRWFCAEEDGRVIGTIAFFREEDGWHAGRFALKPEYRGRHIGTQLISYAFGDIFDSDIRQINMEGRPTTVHILTKLGAVITGETFPFFSSTCTPLRMKKEDFRGELQQTE